MPENVNESEKIAAAMNMTEADKLFNQIHARCLDRWRFILSFRVTSKVGMAAAKQYIEAEKITFVTDLLEGHEYDKILIDKKGFFEANPPKQIVESMTEQTIKETETAMNAASIVFAHSVLDGAAFDYCRVTALVAPDDWSAVLEGRKVSLAEMRGKNYEEVLKQKLTEFFPVLERESLFVKANHLFARCQPPEKWSPMNNYEYDKTRLEKLDNYRHEIIHGQGVSKKIDNPDDEVEYLMKTTLFYMGMVNLKYGLQLNPVYTFRVMAEFAQWAPAAA